MHRHRWLLLVGSLAFLAGVIPMARAGNEVPAEQTGPGCDPSRPAVAHFAGGELVNPQPKTAPVPCMTFTGQPTDTAQIGVTNSGVAFFGPIAQLDTSPSEALSSAPTVPGVPAPSAFAAPFPPTIVARSTNLGAHWERVVPSPAPPASLHGSVIPLLRVDPDTSRVWYATPVPCGPSLGVSISFSDDDGETWKQAFVGCPTQGANSLLEGPAPEGGDQPSGYPNVVYYCANLAEWPLSTRSIVMCHKSLDGGQTFTQIPASPDSVPPKAECGGTDNFAETRVGTVGRDGVLYFLQDICRRHDTLGLAISRDEGATWEHREILQTELQDLYPPSIAADEDNNLFLVWKGEGGVPHLIVSRDAGETWSSPIKVGAPGVNTVRRIAVTARETGHISISYLGSTDGGATYNGYITESRDALASNPVFWSGSVNDPAAPLGSADEPTTTGARIQALNGMIGPDGNPWAAFHCAHTALCPGARVGVAGRLVWPTTG